MLLKSWCFIETRRFCLSTLLLRTNLHMGLLSLVEQLFHCYCQLFVSTHNPFLCSFSSVIKKYPVWVLFYIFWNYWRLFLLRYDVKTLLEFLGISLYTYLFVLWILIFFLSSLKLLLYLVDVNVRKTLSIQLKLISYSWDSIIDSACELKKTEKIAQQSISLNVGILMQPGYCSIYALCIWPSNRFICFCRWIIEKYFTITVENVLQTIFF